MNRHHGRLRTTSLPAILGIGLLTFSLAACGGSDGAGTEASTSATAAVSDSAASSASSDDTPESSVEESSSAPAAESDPGTEDIEAALTSVLGEETKIITGDEVEELQQSSQGLTDSMTITPEECAPEGSANQSAEMPEGTEMTGGVVVETTEVGGVTSDMLSVTVFPDEATATAGMTGVSDFAEACPSYTIELSEGMSATSDTTVEEVDAAGDAALAVTVATSVSLQGAELPEGAGNSTSTSVYVLDGRRLITFAGTAAGGEQKTVAAGVDLIDALRAELDG